MNLDKVQKNETSVPVKNLGKRIKEIRIKKGLTQEELGKIMGKERNYISRFESSEFPNPTIDTVQKFAEALGISSLELLSESDEEYASFTEQQIKHLKGYLSDKANFILKESNPELAKRITPEAIEKMLKSEFSDEFILVPLLTGTVEAGDFNQDFSDWTGDTLPVPKGQYKEKDLVAWKIKGRSLEPDYRDGDAVIVSKDFNCTDGIDVVTTKNESGITIKALKVISDGSVELRPYNADSKTITFESIDEVEAIGEVVGLYRDMRKKRK